MLLGIRDLRGRETPLASVIESFLLSGHDRAKSTQDWYAGYLRDFAGWLKRKGKAAIVGNIEPMIVDAYIGEKRATSPHTARAAAATLKRFAAFLAEYQILIDPQGESVLRRVKLPKVPGDVRKPFKDAEVQQIIARAGEAQNGARDQAIVAVMLGCGLRLNEARQLTLDDLDWGRKCFIVRSVTSKGQRRSRVVRLDSVAARLVDRYVRDFRQPGDGPLFLTDAGKPFTYGGFQRVFWRLKQRCGVDDFMAHRARHTWATNFRRFHAGDLLDLQEEGGWSPRSLAMLRKYSHAKTPEERGRVTPLAAMMRSA
jgi:integrase/recombinase XerC